MWIWCGYGLDMFLGGDFRGGGMSMGMYSFLHSPVVRARVLVALWWSCCDVGQWQKDVIQQLENNEHWL